MATSQVQPVPRPIRSRSLLEPEIAERAIVLSTFPLFAGLTSTECRQMAEIARQRTFERDDLIFAQGQPFRHLVLIVSGCVKLTRLSANGREVILWMRGSSDAIDIAGNLPFSTHTCTARAVLRSRLLVWDWSTLDTVIASSPRISGNICSILLAQMGELQERYREISTDKVAKRVASTLIRLMKQVGTSSGLGTEIFLSREEIAQISGTTLFTVSRLISRWGDLGIVLPRREAVLILDPARLMDVSDHED
jgi:CRP-like cAMP-binding protein